MLLANVNGEGLGIDPANDVVVVVTSNAAGLFMLSSVAFSSKWTS